MRVLRVTAAAATATSCLRHCMAHSVRLLFPAIVPVHGSWMLSITSRSPCLSSPKNRSLDQFSPSELAVLLSRTLPLNQGSTFFFFFFSTCKGTECNRGSASSQPCKSSIPLKILWSDLGMDLGDGRSSPYRFEKNMSNATINSIDFIYFF